MLGTQKSSGLVQNKPAKRGVIRTSSATAGASTPRDSRHVQATRIRSVRHGTIAAREQRNIRQSAFAPSSPLFDC